MAIDPFQITTIEKKAAWQRLLASARDRPPQDLQDAAPDLFVTKLAQHIWRRTQDFTGETTRLISRSVLDAVHDRRSVITHDDLDAVDLSDRSIGGQIDAATAARKGRR